MDYTSLITDRARSVDMSGIRRIFQLAATLDDPINLSIGQPDFEVPEAIRAAATDAINEHHNGYTQTQGDPALLERVGSWLRTDLGWDAPPPGAPGEGLRSFVTSGTSGALVLAYMALLGPGDECIIADPFFVSYPHLATLAGGRAVRASTYPDFRLTAARVEPLITERTKFVLLNTPSNPCGAVASEEDCRGLVDLCRRRGLILITDEIYDEFVYPEALTSKAAGDPSLVRCPSPARVPGAEEHVLLIRGFGKTYGCTGWRLGYAAGPAPIIEQMAKIQQYTFVCPPTPLQSGVVACFETDMSRPLDDYRRRRDMVVERLAPIAELPIPHGAFYGFFRVPERLGWTGTQFVERAIERNLLAIPGGCFSDHDTHVRISFATPIETLQRGLDVIADMLS